MFKGSSADFESTPVDEFVTRIIRFGPTKQEWTVRVSAAQDRNLIPPTMILPLEWTNRQIATAMVHRYYRSR